MSSEAFRRTAPSGKYHCEEVLEAHGWLADPSCVLITWLTLAIPPKRVTTAPTH
jgi:primosomal replication protein N